MTRAVVTLVLTCCLGGCGMKTSPVAPELVEPMPPTNLHATPAPTGVRLVWRRPTRYTGGGPMRDVARFDVERVANDGTDWIVVGTLVMEDRYRLRQPRTIEWIDLGATAGTSYRYRVITVTRDGRASVASAPIAVRHRTVAPERPAPSDPS